MAYSSTLKMEAFRSSELSVDFYQTGRRYIPEDSTLHKAFFILKDYTVKPVLNGISEHFSAEARFPFNQGIL
jgi:hypothetical protein